MIAGDDHLNSGMDSMTPRNAQFVLSITLAIGVLLMTSGCTSTDQRQYAPFVRDLDGLNELEISTYSADFPKRLSEKGAVLKKYESSDELYFQVFIRDKKKKTGANPHVKSITIHSFSYQIGDDPPKLLLSDYRENFWMQGNYPSQTHEPETIPFFPEGRVSIKISFTLNDREYAFDGEMNAMKKSYVLPTIIRNQGM